MLQATCVRPCAKSWIKLASRGGLLHVKDSTYRVFHAMELVVRQFFRREGVEMLPSNPKHHIIESVKQDEDVCFYIHVSVIPQHWVYRML